MTGRIRWEDRAGIVAFRGCVAACPGACFAIYAPCSRDPQWLLRSYLPGQGLRRGAGDDPEKLKAEAERWLEEFVTSIGTVFPPVPVPPQNDQDGYRHVVDDHPDSPWWKWEVSGVCQRSSPGAMVRWHEADGLVKAEQAGEALDWLVTHGPMWECLDPDEPFTIGFGAVSDEAAEPGEPLTGEAGLR
jgi:hypothetical protein